MSSEVIFGMDKIMKKFGFGKGYFYKLTRLQKSPIKFINRRWCCVHDDMIEFIRNFKNEGGSGKHC